MKRSHGPKWGGKVAPCTRISSRSTEWLKRLLITNACLHNVMWKPRCCLSAVVSELQEEGINAINLPLSPSHYELDPEDTMLGNTLLSCLDWVAKVSYVLNSNTSFIAPDCMGRKDDAVSFASFRGERGAHHGGSQLKEWPQAAGAYESECWLFR